MFYDVLNLRPGVKEWFAQWLGRERRDLVTAYREMYGTRSDAPMEYRRALSARLRPLIAHHDLERRLTADDVFSVSSKVPHKAEAAPVLF